MLDGSKWKLGEFNFGGSSFGVYTNTEYAFIANRDDGIVITNISNPSSITTTGRISCTGTFCQTIWEKDEILYFVDNAGLNSYNISDIETY